MIVSKQATDAFLSERIVDGAGDSDGDNYDDMIVNTGAPTILYGSPDAFLSGDEVDISNRADTTRLTSTRALRAFAINDVDGDGSADVAIDWSQRFD